MHRVLWMSLALTGLSLHSNAAPKPASTEPSPIRIVAIDDKTYEPLTVTPQKAAVLVFVLQDCPISNGYAPQIQRLADEFSAKDVSFYLIHVDSTISRDEARTHAKDFGYRIPILIDSHHELVERLNVKTVPSTVVLGATGTARYKGRIDDQYARIGKYRNVATTHELKDAIAAVVEGKPVANAETAAIGCAVPELPNKPLRN